MTMRNQSSSNPNTPSSPNDPADPSREVILVTGATGMVGGQAVRQLAETYADRFRIRALVRNPDAASLPAGVEVVRGDLSDPDSLTGPDGHPAELLEGVRRIFLVWPTNDADQVAEQVIGLFAEHVERIVYLSSAGAEQPTDPVNRSHALLERLIRASGTRWTFLRGGGFARNDLGWTGQLDNGVVSEPFGGWGRSLVHEADLAAVGVRALVTDDLLDTATGPLTGPETLTQAERVAIVSELIGRPLRFVETPLEQARPHFEAWLGSPEAAEQTIAAMRELTREPEQVSDEVPRILGRPARSYRQWVLDHLHDFAGETTAGLAAAYVRMIGQGEFDVIRDQLYAPDFTRVSSDQLDGRPETLVGDEVWRNAEKQGEHERITDVVVDEPFVGEGAHEPNGRFAIRFTFDAVDRATGAALHYPKLSVYTVADGRIAHEQVFFDRPAFAR